MAHFANNSIPFSSGFVDETSTDLAVDEQNIPLDSWLSDPLLVENNNEDTTDGSTSSTHFQEDTLENDSGAKFQEDKLEKDSGVKYQEDSLEIESSTKFEKNSLVFAKLSGHSDPPWPARVAKLCWKRDIHYGYEVFFYGTYQVGIVLTDKVWAYNEESLAKFSKPKISSLRKRGDFSRGLIEIRDCPDIAPSRDIQESASQIAKKLIRSSAPNDDLKVQRKRANSVGVVATSTPDKSNREVKDRGIKQRMERKMTGIEKIQDKNKSKPSSWILSPFRKQDSSSDDGDEVHPTKKMKLVVNDENTSARGKNITRRSKRVKKVPYWKRLEDNKGGALPQNTPKKNTSPEHGSQNIPLQNQNEPKSTYRLRNANKLAASKGVKEKTDSKIEKNNSLILNTPNYRPKITEMSPRPQKKSGETRNTPGRRVAAIDTRACEEVLQQPKSNRNTPGRRAAAADDRNTPGRRDAAADDRNTPGRRDAAADDRNTPGRRDAAVDTGGSEEVLRQSKSNRNTPGRRAAAADTGGSGNTPGRRADAVDTGGSEEVLRQSKSNRNTPGRRDAAADTGGSGNTPGRRAAAADTGGSEEVLLQSKSNRNTPGRRATAVDTGGSEEVLLQSKSNAKVMQSSFPKEKVTHYIKSGRSLQTVEADCRIVKEEPLSENPREWTVAQTLSSIIRMDPSIEPEDIRPFREHKIDGSALIQLNFHDIVTYCKIKVGPAIKVSNIIRTLKASTQNPEKL